MSDNIDHATLKAIVKYRNHPSIPTITSEHENTPKFSINFVSKEHVLEEIQMLDSSKAIQERDIPVNLTKENNDLFAEIICKIAKLHAYGLDLASLKILQDYLTNIKQRTKVDFFIVLGKRYYQVYHKVLY